MGKPRDSNCLTAFLNYAFCVHIIFGV